MVRALLDLLAPQEKDALLMPDGSVDPGIAALTRVTLDWEKETVRTKNMVPVHRVSFWRGVPRDYLLRRSLDAQIPRKEEEKATSKKSLFRPPYRDNFFLS